METKTTSKGEKNAVIPTTEKTAKVENQSNSVESAELQKQNAQLLKRIQELEKQATKPKDLQAQIDYFEYKKKLINNLEILKLKKGELFDAFAVIQPIAESDDFEKNDFSLVLEHYAYSRGKEVFKISNPHVISNCIGFILKAVENKILTLSEEIQK